VEIGKCGNWKIGKCENVKINEKRKDMRKLRFV
jgi:hypothetical protein